MTALPKQYAWLAAEPGRAEELDPAVVLFERGAIGLAGDGHRVGAGLECRREQGLRGAQPAFGMAPSASASDSRSISSARRAAPVNSTMFRMPAT